MWNKYLNTGQGINQAPSLLAFFPVTAKATSCAGADALKDYAAQVGMGQFLLLSLLLVRFLLPNRKLLKETLQPHKNVDYHYHGRMLILTNDAEPCNSVPACPECKQL